MSNVALERLCARLLTAALALNEAAESIEDREAISLSEVEELKCAVDGAARSLNLCSSILHHCTADMLTPGITCDDLDKRAGARWEAAAFTIIRNALAGEQGDFN